MNDGRIFESTEEGDGLIIHYSYLRFVQVYTILAYYFHWFIETNLGKKSKEKMRN